jgi:small-conductance mechanosensitive channel
VAACVLAAGGAVAQAPAPEPAAAPARPPEPPPETIAIPEIATRAEQTTSLLRTLETKLAEDPNVAAIRSSLPDLIASNLALAAETTEYLEPGSRRQMVDSLAESWRGVRARIAEQSAVLTQRASGLEAQTQLLASQRDLWQRTLEAARAAKAPDTTTERVAATLVALAGTQRAIDQQRASVLELQDRVVRELGVADAAIEQIASFRRQVIGNLWSPDRRPLWRAMRSDDAAGAALGDLAHDLEGIGRQIANYAQAQWSRFLAQLGLFLVLVWLFRAARTRTLQTVEEEPELAQVAAVFQVPYSAALMLTLLSTFWFHPHAPLAIGQLAALLAVIPVLHIVQPLVDPALVSGIRAFGAFYAIDRVRDLTSTAPLFEQVLFMIEMLGGIALMLWILRPRRLEGMELSAEQRAALRPVGFAARLLLASFTLALLSGAAGYMELARLVGGGALLSTYFALALFAGVRAAGGLLIFAFRVRPLRLLRLVSTHRDSLRRRSHRLLRVLGVGLWAVASLRAFGLLDSTLAAGQAALDASVSFGSLTLSFSHVAAFAVTVLGAFLISRVLRFVLEEDVFPRISLARGVPYAISSLLHYAILLGGFFLAISALGVDLTRVTVLAGAFGVGIGFGLQNVVNNFVSGLIMLFERPMKLGDTVQVADVSGVVERIGMRSSTLRTVEGAEVVVPNASLISDRLTNWTLNNTRRRVDVKVGVAYGTDPQKMLELLLSAARAQREILAFPAPVALFMGFGESSLDFELRAWTDAFDDWVQVRSGLALEVHRKLGEAGIEVPFPQRVLRVRPEPL